MNNGDMVYVSDASESHAIFQKNKKRYVGPTREGLHVVESSSGISEVRYVVKAGNESLAENLLQLVYEDIQQLKSGDWVPDEHSCQCTLDHIEEIARLIGVEVSWT